MNPYLQKLARLPHRRRGLQRARIEILPLIDVMFLLVAFFMVVSISMVMQKGIFVDLSPAETSDSSMQEQDTLVISVDADGSFFLNKEKILAELLADVLSKAAQDDKDIPVVINADKQARHESVIEALDLVRRSELHNVIFSVEPKE